MITVSTMLKTLSKSVTTIAQWRNKHQWDIYQVKQAKGLSSYSCLQTGIWFMVIKPHFLPNILEAHIRSTYLFSKQHCDVVNMVDIQQRALLNCVVSSTYRKLVELHFLLICCHSPVLTSLMKVVHSSFALCSLPHML